MKNSKSLSLLVLLIAFGLGACNSNSTKTTETNNNKTSTTMTTENKIIVDVRTVDEWNNDGHADCSVNYPLDQIESKIEELKKYESVILVCRSGNRAGIAQGILKNAGVKNIENLGPWQNVSCN